MNSDIVISCKVVLLGESAVGKSSLVLRFSKGMFLEYQESTIGASFLTQSVKMNDHTIKFEIWDTAGQERYHSLAPMYYRGAHAGLVVYDVTNRASFEKAKSWVRELQRQAPAGIIIALAGNKADKVANSEREVANSDREVGREEAEQLASENGLVFMETSAKSALNVNEIFVEIAKKIQKKPQIRIDYNKAAVDLQYPKKRGGKCNC